MGNRRVRLVVLFGGRSAEHEVSCVSARHVLAAADPDRYRVEAVGITKQGLWVHALQATDALQSDPARLPAGLAAAGPQVDPMRILSDRPEDDPTASDRPTTSNDPTASDRPEDDPTTVVLPVLHGPMGEDGTIQGLLELADVPYAGAGVLASALCMDKPMTKTVLASTGIAHARWKTVTVDDSRGNDSRGNGSEGTAEDVRRPGGPTRAEAAEAVARLGLPVFVKPANMGSSVGISKASTMSEVVDAIHLASGYDRTVIVEEAVNGREVEVAVIGNDDPVASLPGEIVPGADFYTYDDKYSDGAELLIPAPLSSGETAEAQSLAIAAYQALRVEGLARVDFLYEDGRDGRGDRGWLVSELNTMPGFTPISMYPKLWDASGIGYPELIDRLVALAIERHARKRRHTRTDR